MDNLELTLTHSELTSSLNGFAPRKASGFDGLPIEFYKASWALLGPDLFQIFQESIRVKILPLN